MGKSTRGYCKYCSKEYTRTGMVKHLQTCKRRVDLYEKASFRCRLCTIQSIFWKTKHGRMV